MRRPWIVLSALVLVIVSILPATVPVAASRSDAQPVSWVSWEGNMTPMLLAGMGMDGHFDGSVMVMKRADTISGFVKSKNFVTHEESFCIQFISATFTGNTAVIDGWFYDPGWGGTMEDPVEEIWTLVDSGEPGVGNDLMHIRYYDSSSGQWRSWLDLPFPVPLASHGNIQVHNGR